MISKKFPALNILLIVAMLLSFAAVVTPAEKAQAAAPSAATVISPSTASPITVASPSTITVTFTVSDNNTHTNAQVFIYQGTTEYHSTAASVGTPSVYTNGYATYTQTINISAGAPAGYYLCYATVEGTISPTQSNAVYVDTTLPVAYVSVASTCWSTNQYIPGTTTLNSYAITYSGTKSGSTSLTYEVMLSLDGGANYTVTLFSGADSPGTYTVNYSPYPTVTTFQYAMVRCKVTDVATGLVSAYSTSSLIYIMPNPNAPVLSYPNASGLSFNGGSSISVTGTIYAAASTASYMLSMHPGGSPWTGTYENITAGWQNVTISGSYAFTKPWTVSTSTNSAACVIVVWTKDCAGNIVCTAGTPFTIVPTTGVNVRINWPTSAAVMYTCSTTDNVTFTLSGGTGGTSDCTAYYSTDNTTWTSFGYKTCSSGSNFINWTHTGLAAGTYYIRVMAVNNSITTYGHSYAFTMKALSGPPTIRVVSPNGGESLTGGTTSAITYICTDTYDSGVPITYTISILASGSDNGTIATFTLRNANGSTGSFTWPVNNVTGSNYKIRISASDPCGNSIYDDSDAVFSITAGCAVITYDIPLKAGWNLISFPIMPLSTDITSILSGVSSNINSVYYYKSATWYIYVPGVFATLGTMSDGNAYWVNAKADCTLTLTGRLCPCGGGVGGPSYSYTTGWNMVGFKSTVDKAVNSYMPYTCGTQYASPVYSYDATTQQMISLDCGDNMTPGRGYWFYNGVAYGLFPGCR